LVVVRVEPADGGEEDLPIDSTGNQRSELDQFRHLLQLVANAGIRESRGERRIASRNEVGALIESVLGHARAGLYERSTALALIESDDLSKRAQVGRAVDVQHLVKPRRRRTDDQWPRELTGAEHVDACDGRDHREVLASAEAVCQAAAPTG